MSKDMTGKHEDWTNLLYVAWFLFLHPGIDWNVWVAIQERLVGAECFYSMQSVKADLIWQGIE